MSACAFIAKMGKMQIILVFVLACMLTGCSIASMQIVTPSASFEPVNTITVQVAITDTPSSTPSSTRSPTPVPTETITLTLTPSTTTMPTPTATNTKTATITPYAIQQACLEINDPTNAGFALEGKPLRFCDQGVCVLEVKNQISRERAINPTKLDTLFAHMAISPDRKWFAYEDITFDQAGEIQSNQLRIVSSGGQVKPIVGWKVEWRLDSWRDNEKINAERWDGEEHYIILFDPHSGKAQETLLPPLNDPYPGDLLIKDARANYDLTYTRVVYLYENYDANQTTFALWDIQEDKLLWQRSARDEMLFGSDWSSDGQEFIVAGALGDYQNELFMVSREGKETQLTHLTAAYPSMKVVIGNFSLSPDGRYISLWYNAFPGDYFVDWRLAILDTQTGKLTDTCILSSASQYPSSIWSPSRRQLAVQTFIGEDIGEHYLIVIDLPSGQAMKLPTGGFLVGWMASP